METQRGFAHLLLIAALLAGIAGGVYLIQTKQIFQSRAADDRSAIRVTSLEVAGISYSRAEVESEIGVDLSGTSNLPVVVHFSDGSQKPLLLKFQPSSQTGGSCGTTCSECILNQRSDVLPFYSQNGWDTQCANRDNVVANWCGIDPSSCNNLKQTTCQSQCLGGDVASDPSCRWERRDPECDWGKKQVYEVYQNSCTGEYDRRNYQYQDNQCGYTKGSPPTSSTCQESRRSYGQCGGTTGLESYPSNHTIEVTEITNCQGAKRYENKDLGNRGECS